MDAEQVFLGQEDKKWDRVWTTDEIRKNSANWTLAGDVGLYNLLNEFSQNVISRTHEVQNAVNTLVHNTKMASVKINNVINDFHMLSNVQFVENRVYDEEVQEPIAETKPTEKTKEQREAEMLPKIIKAVQLGMAVLDQAFNRINVNEISDSEDEDLSSEGRTILEPKNPYEHRPLPYIIGSEEFMADDYAGLKDLIQEDVESSVELESSSTESDETSSDEEELPLDEDKFSEVPTPRREVQSISDRYSSSEESELFGIEKEENDLISDSSIDAKVKENTTVQKHEEANVDVRDSRQDSVSSIQSRLKLPQVLPVPKQTQKRSESEDLFANDNEASDEESPFRKKSGLFASEIRFDEDKDIFESDLFGSKPKEITKPKESPKTLPAPKLPVPATKNKEPDLFGDDEDSEDDIFNKLTKAKKPSVTKESIVTKQESPDKAYSSSSPSSAPSIKPSGNAFDFVTGAGTSDPLFGDDSDGDDLFSTKKTVTKKFDFDSTANDDLFGLTTEKKPKKTEANAKKKSIEADKTSPLFDAGSSTDKSYKKLGMPLPGLAVKNPIDSIFEDSDTDQGDKQTLIKPVTSISKPKKDISIFDDDDDDEEDIFSQKPKLFSPGKSPSVKNKPEDSLPKDEVKELQKDKKLPEPNLFDDFDQEDKSEATFLPITKKADTSLFEESDSFDLFKPKVIEKPKQPEVIASSQVSQIISKDSKSDTLEQIDGAVASTKQKSLSPIKTQESENSRIGFDVPVDSSKTLNVLSKDRVKITAKRRKPTRKARLAALEDNDKEKESDSLSSPTTKSSITDSADDLFSSEEPEPVTTPKITQTHKSQEKAKMNLMSQLMSEAASSKVLKKTPIKKEEDDVVDIFAELDGKRDSKSQSFSFLSPIESTGKSSLLQEEKTDEKDISSVLDSEEGDHDEFFAEPSFKNFSNSISKKNSILDMDDEDDLFSSLKPNTVIKPKVDTSDDIFAEDTDIFADIQKEKYEMFPSQLYDDEDEDDIFSSIDQSSSKVDKPKPKVTNSVPLKKEVEKKPVFNDPLGLLGED